MKCRNPLRVKMNRTIGSAQGAGIAAVPCGQCKNCRINQSRIWANRILLEQRVHGESVFVTLTYDEKNLPKGGNLVKKHLQDYLKRLRYFVYPIKIRYFAVGEYGDKSMRPHYHLAIFGLGMINEKVIKKAWDYGDDIVGKHVGELNKDTARYISGYIVKKINKIRGLHPTNYGLEDEFMLSSKKDGGIGSKAIEIIADNLEKNKYWTKRHKLSSIKNGGKTFPLGRYLSKKVNDALGTDEKVVLMEFWANQELFFEKCHGVSKDELFIRKGKI